MQFQIAIQVIISGIMLGAIYSLLAMGLTLIYGVVQIVNFAHGEFLMIGMFITFWLWSLLSGLDPLFSLFVVTPSLFLFGVIVYRFFFARVVNKSDEAKIFLTAGLSMVLQNLALLVFKADYRTLKTVYSDLYFRVGEVTVGFPKLLAFVSAILIAAGLAYLLIKTDFGKAMRAAAQDPAGRSTHGHQHRPHLHVGRGAGFRHHRCGRRHDHAVLLCVPDGRRPFYYHLLLRGDHGGIGQCEGGLLVRADSRFGRKHGKLFHLQRFGVDDILYFAGIRFDVQTARTPIQGAHLNEGSIGIHNQIRFHRLCQTG